jgi:phosphatidylserine decarboxylase
MIAHLLISATISSLLYYYLHKKTRISLRYMFKDNLVVILFGCLLSFGVEHTLRDHSFFVSYFLDPVFVIGLAFGLTMIRFWRTPIRKICAATNEIVSPADGNVIYITRIEAGEIPVSIKENTCSRLEELTKVDILSTPCWLVGINMTPFDVHKNCAPIDGVIIVNQHFNGKFLSLKDRNALVENERNTYVIQGKNLNVGVVQIASKLVRRIDSYVKEGDPVKRGDWLGMIRFGSQVDVIIPIHYSIIIKIKDHVYAGESIISRIAVNNENPN